MSNEDLQQLKALALAATPGPWSECGNARGGCSCGQVWSTSADMPVATAERGDEEIGPIAPEVYKANAKYIAAANPAAILAMIERIESLAAPAVANGAAGLPALPWGDSNLNHESEDWLEVRTGDEIGQAFHDYARAAIAASTQQAAPKQALTDADFLRQWEITRDKGDYSSMMFVTDAAIIAFARDIEAAAGPNALLVAALKKLCQAVDNVEPGEGGTRGYGALVDAQIAAEDALASVPTAPEAI